MLAMRPLLHPDTTPKGSNGIGRLHIRWLGTERMSGQSQEWQS